MHLWTLMKTSLDALVGAPTMTTRRSFVIGATTLGALALATPSILAPVPAAAAPAAALPDLDPVAGDLPMSVPVEPAQYSHNSHRRRRWRRRELARMCRNNRRFRRDNRGLCRRVTGWHERPGVCVQVGPVVICD